MRGNKMHRFQTVLKSLRKENKLTQDELSGKLGISKSTISMYENGKRQPDFENLEMLADFFNVDMNYLLGWTKARHMVLSNDDWNEEELREIEWFKNVLLEKRK